ncbi:lasso peptide biosynthesis B2 protein [Humibacter ginsengisoli]
MAVAARVEAALRRGGVDRAAKIGHLRVGLDGAAAPVALVTDVALSDRELEKLDVAWRVLRQRPFNGTCLRRAIVGGYFLRDRDPVLRVGVTKSSGKVAAHAWVEVDGVGLDPDGSDKYPVLRSPMETAT